MHITPSGSGSNESVLYNAFLKPFARYLVELLPPWVAPNVLTVAGLGLCWVNFVLMAVLNPRMDAPVPRWAYIVCAVNVFVYQMLDNMDGQHARRIGVCVCIWLKNARARAARNQG